MVTRYCAILCVMLLWFSVNTALAVESAVSDMEPCNSSVIETGISWTKDLTYLLATSVVPTSNDVIDEDFVDKAVLQAKIMLGRYRYGLDKKLFNLSGAELVKLCYAENIGVVAQVRMQF